MWKWCWLFGWWDVIHNEFLRRGPTVNEECCVNLKRLRDLVRRKESLTYWRGKWLLYHYSALAHSSLLIPYTSQHETTLVSELASLASVDFFSKLKYVLKGRFESIEMKGNLLAEQRSIRKETFQECFQNSKKRRERCIKSGVVYLERVKSENTIYLNCS
jgi:hypothetical protein